MTARALSSDERVGLGLAALGHAALIALLVSYRPAPPPPPPERMTVTLSEQTGAVSTSPEPLAQPAPDKGPEIGEPAPAPEPVPAPQAQPQPRPTLAPPPPRPSAAAAAKAPVKPAPAAQPPRAQPAKAQPTKAGASQFDSVFGKGIPGGATGKSQNAPASQASAQQVASWSSSINARVRGPWNSCPVSGLDVNRLRASVRFTLDRNGRVLGIEDFDVTGVTDANRAQVRPFKDCAVRAIKLAAPFTGLPPEFYDQWMNRKLNFSKQ
ncbi:MAG: hypothetical protein ACKOPE_07505 [Novosphingobium sp.]